MPWWQTRLKKRMESWRRSVKQGGISLMLTISCEVARTGALSLRIRILLNYVTFGRELSFVVIDVGMEQAQVNQTEINGFSDTFLLHDRTHLVHGLDHHLHPTLQPKMALEGGEGGLKITLTAFERTEME
jgi:hypothetical protein